MSSHRSITTRLLLARHGETPTSLSGAFAGSTEVLLTPTGQQQAQCLADRLHYEHIDVLYCSPQKRAVATATPTATALDLPIQTREELREMHFGTWEGHTYEKLSLEYPETMDAWKRGSWMTCLPGDAETFQGVIARAVPCLAELVRAHVGQTLLVVSHKTTLRLALSQILEMPLPASRHLELETASLTELHLTGNDIRLIRLNDTTHLLP
jgi:broad specificity phosphatase PhoE